MEEEFDVVEEEPDEVSTTSDELELSKNDTDNKVWKDLPKKDAFFVDKELSGYKLGQIGRINTLESKERVAKIQSVKLTVWDYFSVLDYEMLGLFFQCMIGFFISGLFLSLIYLTYVYFFNEDIWYEYFPVEDDYNIDDILDNIVDEL